MARNVNIVALTGNLTRDPELRHLPSGQPVCTLGLAVNERYFDKSSNQYVEKVNYFDIVVWGKQGESCAQFLAKGRPVAVQGRLQWRSWKADDGSTRSKVEVVADIVQFLNTRDGSGGGGGGRSDDDPGDYGFPPRGGGDDYGTPATSTGGGDFGPVGTADDIPF